MNHSYEYRLWVALSYLLEQVDEDCPQEYRTKHLLEAMEDAKELLDERES